MCVQRGSSRQCQRVALASTGVVVVQRLDLFRFVYLSNALEVRGMRARARISDSFFVMSYSLLSNVHVEWRTMRVFRACWHERKINVTDSDFRCCRNYLFKSSFSWFYIRTCLYVTSLTFYPLIKCLWRLVNRDRSLYRWQKAIKNISKVDRP